MVLASTVEGASIDNVTYELGNVAGVVIATPSDVIVSIPYELESNVAIPNVV